MQERNYLQSEIKSESPKTNPMYDVPIARNENTSTIGCTALQRDILDHYLI